MIRRLLIANRGEIAVRIIRTCKEMNIETVAVYSTADKEALHVQLADYAVCIGGPRANDSYLNMKNILVDEPCYYSIFLSEDGYFVRKSNEKEMEQSRRIVPKTSNADGHIGYTRAIREALIPAWMDEKLRGDKKKRFLACTLSFQGKRYMKLTPMETLEGIPSENEVARLFKGRTYFYQAEEPVTFQYRSKQKHSIKNHRYRIPIAFYRAMGFQEGNPVHLEFLEDGSLVLTPKINCDICGEPIDSYWDESSSIKITKNVHVNYSNTSSKIGRASC